MAKKLNFDCNYRGDMYYRHYFTTVGAEAAYDAVIENLKHKTHAFEDEVAIRLYEEIYQRPFQSKEERKLTAVELENERLKKEVEELRKKKTVVAEKITENGKTIDFSKFPKDMDKEKFKEFFSAWYEKSQGIAPSNPIWGKAYVQYMKGNVENQA